MGAGSRGKAPDCHHGAPSYLHGGGVTSMHLALALAGRFAKFEICLCDDILVPKAWYPADPYAVGELLGYLSV